MADAPGWTTARSLATGDEVLGDSGVLTVVANAGEAHRQGVKVYNLEVEQAHTYFVLAEHAPDGADAVWVHNATYTNKAMRGAVNATDEAGYRWYRSPFTNKLKRTRLRMAAAHVVPSKEIENMPGYRLLSPEQQIAIKTDMRNIQALPLRINYSKGARTSADLKYVLGKEVSKNYLNWLSRKEKSLRGYLQ